VARFKGVWELGDETRGVLFTTLEPHFNGSCRGPRRSSSRSEPD